MKRRPFVMTFALLTALCLLYSCMAKTPTDGETGVITDGSSCEQTVQTKENAEVTTFGR